MNISHIAVPYAKALFGLSIEKNQLEEIRNDMMIIASLFEKSKEFRLMLKSPVISEEKKGKIFTRIFEKSISTVTLTFLSIIIRKKREAYIGDIAFAFLELYNDHRGIIITKLKTAAPVSDEIREMVREMMKTQAPGEVELIEEIDPALIGGFILQWKDRQYNASIRKQISRLQRGVTMVNLYKKEF